MTALYAKPTCVLKDEATGLTVNIYASEEYKDGKSYLNITYKIDGHVGGDINGLFIDWCNDGGSKTYEGSKANNMNGAGDGWDYAKALGSIGGNDADNTYGTICVEGKSLKDLYGSEIGIRATSVGYDREDSAKMTCVVEKPHEPPVKDHFPDFKETYDRDISNVVFYFATGYGDTKPTPNGDGYFTVKIDNYPGSASDDLDDDLADILAYIQAQNAGLDLDTLVGVAIKGGQEQKFFELDNNHDEDAVPGGSFIVNNAIDQSYDYSAVPFV